MPFPFRITLLALMLAAAAPHRPAPEIDAAGRRRVLDALIRQLHARYVFPDSVARIEALLRSRSRAGAYDTTTIEGFGARVTNDLRTFDRHFDLRFDLEREKALLAAGSDTSRVLPDLDPTPDSLAGLRRDNFGFHRADRLRGNVGLLEVTFLHDLRFARPTAAAATSFLMNADACILDLRSCPGGYASMVDFLAGTFFGTDSVRLLTTYDRELGTTQQGWSKPGIAERHLPNTDLYILSSGATGSAAEALLFEMQVTRRATVIGERTAGAAHAGGWVPLHGGFVVFIPNARAFDPRTGRDWEGTGIEPDIAAPAARALERAHAEAVRRLAAKNHDARRAAEYAWLQPYLDREAEGPLELPLPLLERHAGRYERCEIRIEANELRFLGASGVPQRLIPLTETVFRLEDERFAPPDQIRIRFASDSTTALELLVNDGRVLPRRRIRS